MWNPSAGDCECNKTIKVDEYLDIKNHSCEKRLFGKLVLAYKGETLNKTEISLIDKKKKHVKRIIIGSYFYYYAKRQIEKGI